MSFMDLGQEVFHHAAESGYVDASNFMDLDDQPEHTLIDEEAMQNDFDQLINLEGHNTTGMDLLSYDTVSQEESTDSIDWLAQPTRKTGSVCSILPKQEEADTNSLIGGMVMPAHDPEEMAGLEHVFTNQLEASVHSIEAAKRRTAELRREITGADKSRKNDTIVVVAAA